MFQEMKDFLVQSGVKKVIVACPNCHRIFSLYGEGLAVSTVYELMDAHPLASGKKVAGTVTVHDPCPLRFSPAVQASVRNLIVRQGLTVEEMPHHGERTVCCGEEDSLPYFRPSWPLGGRRSAKTRRQAGG